VKNELFVAALIIFIIGEEVIKKERTAFHKKTKKDWNYRILFEIRG